MKYCPLCAAPLVRKIPPGDNRERHVCDDCDTVHYQNPKIVAGCVPVWEDRVLLCKRAIEPRYGRWTLPAGFMENQESAPEAAERETLEEARARVEIIDLYTLISLPHINQVYMMFRAKLLDLDFGAGDESLEVGLFAEHEVPWDEMAFPTVYHTLRFYFEDHASSRFRFRMGDILSRDEGAGEFLTRRG